MVWIVRLAKGALALVVLAALVLAVYAWRTLPRTDGTVVLQGPGAEIRIERDAHGIPTVHAASLRDAAFAVGFLHAQDRLWQLETHRRIAAGRLAEVFGEAALPNDRFLRALGVRRAAAAQLARLDAESRTMLDAYAAGINAVLRDELRARPPEFVLLGVQPEPWQAVDSLGWATMMAWDLGGNWGLELLRMRLALRHPVDKVNELLPPYPGDKPLPTRDYAALYRSLKLGNAGTAVSWSALPDVAPPSGVEGTGSNNWVLAGTRTTSGAPLLANDPHLRLSTPALWYFVRLRVPGLAVAGASLPGMPLVVLGQNEHVAWGFTNTGPDVQDLYIEQLDAADASRYRTPDGWAAFETADEVIRVKGKADVAMKVRRTRHGPVISDAGSFDDVFAGKASPPHVLAMRWTALDDDAQSVGVALRMMKAKSVAEFVAAAEGWVAPMQNMVVADRAGRIGFVAAGRVPLRKPDNDLRGLAPAPGWEARYDWAGWLDAQLTPRRIDPAEGSIATANQRIHEPDYPHFITADWALPYRQQRIEQLIAARPKHSIDDLAAMHADAKSLAAAGLLPLLLQGAQASSSHPLAAAALAELRGFDGTMAADRAAPLLWWAWSRRFAEAVYADDFGAELWERSGRARSFRDAFDGLLAGGAASAWCDDRRTPAVETCAEMSALAFGRALDELRARHGDDVAAWRWGRAHEMRGEHRPFSRVPLLARWFEQRVATAGDTFTVNASRVVLREAAAGGDLYWTDHGPSLRAIYDLADAARSRFMHSTGQSGIVFSPWYGDFAAPWAQVRYVPLWSAEPPAHTLVLQPGGN